MKRNLCDERLEQVSIHVEASIEDGKLTISGQDIGQVVEEFFGDSDYEYFYSFDKANTRKLLEAFKPGAEMKEFLELLAGKFSGLNDFALLFPEESAERCDFLWSFATTSFLLNTTKCLN